MENILPNNWVETDIGSITTKPQYGWTSKSNDFGCVKYLRTTDLSKGIVDWDKVPYCLEAPDDINKYLLEHNDILISRAGSVGLSYRVSNPPEDVVFASYLIRFKTFINSKIVSYYLLTSAYWEHISDMSAGIAVQNVNAPKLASLRIPLPPLAEQERIAAKLDVLFGQLDMMRRSAERIPDLIKNFRQQILTYAVTGRLTHDWRQNKNLKSPSIKTLEVSDYFLHKIPTNWIYSIIENIGKVKGGKRLPAGEELVNDNTGFPYIRARDLKEGTVLVDNLMYLLPETQFKIKNYIVKTDDVYITIVGAKIGDAGIIPLSMNNANLTENAAKITDLHSELLPRYLSLWLRASICQFNIQDSIKSAAQGKLALSRINKLPIYIPPTEEQTEIVNRVESLFEKLDSIERRYKTLMQKIENLPQALLHKAFKGELVEQLPTDGNAADLLHEITQLKNSLKK